MLCTALMLTACSDENGNGGKPENIELVNNTPEKVVVKADETENGQAISFKAVAPWKATVNDVTPTRAVEAGKEVEWVKLSAYSGEAGDVSLSMSFTKNFTGMTRKAEIIIECGDTAVKITIEQVAENSDGSVTKQVKTVKMIVDYPSEFIDNPNYKPGSQESISNSVMTYHYDDKGRVSRISDLEDGYEESEIVYDYSVVGEISVTSRYNYDGATEEEKYIVTLNDKGNAVKVREFNKEKKQYLDKHKLDYNEDGRLKNLTTYDKAYDRKYSSNFEYKEGFWTRLEYKYDEYDSSVDVYNFDIPTYYPNKCPNNNIIDMTAFLTNFDEFDYESFTIISSIGKIGKTSDYLIERIKKRYELANVSEGESYEKPGTIIYERTHKKADFSEYYDEYKYEYDKDKNLSKVILTQKFDIIEVKEKEIVTDEVIKEYPGQTIKKYRTKIERKYKKLGEGKDTVTYTLEY